MNHSGGSQMLGESKTRAESGEAGIRRPPKGDPKRGIRKVVTFTWLESDLKVTFGRFVGRTPLLGSPFGGQWTMIAMPCMDAAAPAHVAPSNSRLFDWTAAASSWTPFSLTPIALLRIPLSIPPISSGQSKRGRIKGVWASPNCFWSPIGDLSNNHFLVLCIICCLKITVWKAATCAGAADARVRRGSTRLGVDSFQMGSGQTGSSQKCRNSPQSTFMGECGQAVANYGNMQQHVHTYSNIWQNAGDLWPFCKKNKTSVPTPSGSRGARARSSPAQAARKRLSSRSTSGLSA